MNIVNKRISPNAPNHNTNHNASHQWPPPRTHRWRPSWRRPGSAHPLARSRRRRLCSTPQ